MTLDDGLVKSVDKIVQEQKTTRSAFTRQALREAVDKARLKVLEEKHRRGYELQPVNQEVFSMWAEEQAWGDE